MNLYKLAKRLRDGKDRILLKPNGQLVIESNGEVLEKADLPNGCFELLEEHAECTQEQQGIIARMFPHLKGAGQ